MGLRRPGVGLVGIIMVCGWATGASAHARDYIVNQQYYTTKRGEFEVELYNDYHLPEAHHDGTYNSTHQVEMEYGITDHLQLAYYEVYTWDRAEDWERDAFKIEAKYRFAEAGRWPLDVALYTEYENPDGSRHTHSDVLENKVIVSRDFGPWNLIGNFIFEKALNTSEPWAFEYTAGVSYGITARTRAGLEIKQGLGTSDRFEFNGSQSVQLLPGIYHSFSPHVRVLFGPAFGVSRPADDLQLRSILEVEF